MDEIRRDATDTSGDLAVQKMHCDDDLLLDAGPCACAPDACVVVLLPCCSCPAAIAYIVDSPQLQALWPFDTRGDGRVVRMTDGRCYRYVATVPEVPPFSTLEYTFDSIDRFTTCDDPDCGAGDCVSAAGAVITLASPCTIATQEYDCVESFDYAYSESGTGFLQLEPGNPFFEYTLEASSAFEGTFALGQTSSGTWDVRTVGTREAVTGGLPLSWDYSESYEAPTSPVSLVAPTPPARAIVENPADLPPEVWSTGTTGPGTDPGDPGHNLQIDGASFCEQGIRREVETNGNLTVERTSIVRVRETALGRSVHAFWSYRKYNTATGQVLERAYNRLVRRFAFSRVRFASGVELPDLTTEDQCALPSTVWAYQCGAEDPSDPAVRIVVDLAEVPDPGSLQYRGWYRGELYIVTGEIATGEAVEVVWTLDDCPEPGTGGGLYKLRFCRSTRDFPSHWVQGGPNDAPRSLTVAYEPGDGLAPGEGLVIAGFPAGAQLCLTALPVQPTTEPYEGEPDVVLRSVPGSCRSTPVRNIDQRPQCQPVDGGGGVGPSDGIAFTDPRVTAQANAQIANNWGGGCCG